MNKEKIIENFENNKNITENIVSLVSYLLDESLEEMADETQDQWDDNTIPYLINALVYNVYKDDDLTDPIVKDGIYIEHIHKADQGDEEGAGEYSCKVFKISIDEKEFHVKIEGYYNSYEGTTWNDEFILVKPVERTVTFYE